MAPYFECRPRSQVSAKGKGKVEMFFVQRLRPAECAADADGLLSNDAFWAATR